LKSNGLKKIQLLTQEWLDYPTFPDRDPNLRLVNISRFKLQTRMKK